MLYLVLTFIHIILYDVPDLYSFYWVMLHSGASLPSAWFSRVTVRDSTWVDGVIEPKVVGNWAHVATLSAALGVFRGLPGPRRAMTSPSAPMTCGPAMPALLFLDPTVCHSLSKSLVGASGRPYLPGS